MPPPIPAPSSQPSAINADYAWIRHLAYHHAARFCYAALCFCFLLSLLAYLLFACWLCWLLLLLFSYLLFGFYFYTAARFIYIRTHKGISLNTKTTCGNRNNKKSQNAHTLALAHRQTAGALHLIISHTDIHSDKKPPQKKEKLEALCLSVVCVCVPICCVVVRVSNDISRSCALCWTYVFFGPKNVAYF